MRVHVKRQEGKMFQKRRLSNSILLFATWILMAVFGKTQAARHSSWITPLPQTGPGGTISYLEAFPDGDRIFSVDRNRSVGIWQADGGWAVQHFPVGAYSAYSGAVSPDGRYVVSGGIDGRVMLWRVEDEQVVAIGRHRDIVIQVAYSRDGKYYASSAQDGTIQIWQAPSGKLVRAIRQTEPLSAQIAFLPSSQEIAIVTATSVISIQRIVDGVESKHVSAGLSGVSRLAATENGMLAELLDNGSVVMWDLAKSTSVPRWRAQAGGGKGAEHLTIGAKQQILIAGSMAELSLLNMETGQLLHSIKHVKAISAVCVHPDGDALFLALDEEIAVYDLATALQLRSFNSSSLKIAGMAFSPDGKSLAVGNSGYIGIWDWANGVRTRAIPINESLTVTSYSDENTIGAYGRKNALRLSLGTEDKSSLWETKRRTYGIGMSSDGSRVVTAIPEGTGPALRPSRLEVWSLGRDKSILSTPRNE